MQITLGLLVTDRKQCTLRSLKKTIVFFYDFLVIPKCHKMLSFCKSIMKKFLPGEEEHLLSDLHPGIAVSRLAPHCVLEALERWEDRNHGLATSSKGWSSHIIKSG